MIFVRLMEPEMSVQQCAAFGAAYLWERKVKILEQIENVNVEE